MEKVSASVFMEEMKALEEKAAQQKAIEQQFADERAAAEKAAAEKAAEAEKMPIGEQLQEAIDTCNEIADSVFAAFGAGTVATMENDGTDNIDSILKNDGQMEQVVSTFCNKDGKQLADFAIEHSSYDDATKAYMLKTVHENEGRLEQYPEFREMSLSKGELTMDVVKDACDEVNKACAEQGLNIKQAPAAVAKDAIAVMDTNREAMNIAKEDPTQVLAMKQHRISDVSRELTQEQTKAVAEQLFVKDFGYDRESIRVMQESEHLKGDEALKVADSIKDIYKEQGLETLLVYKYVKNELDRDNVDHHLDAATKQKCEQIADRLESVPDMREYKIGDVETLGKEEAALEVMALRASIENEKSGNNRVDIEIINIEKTILVEKEEEVQEEIKKAQKVYKYEDAEGNMVYGKEDGNKATKSEQVASNTYDQDGMSTPDLDPTSNHDSKDAALSKTEETRSQIAEGKTEFAQDKQREHSEYGKD